MVKIRILRRVLAKIRHGERVEDVYGFVRLFAAYSVDRVSSILLARRIVAICGYIG